MPILDSIRKRSAFRNLNDGEFAEALATVDAVLLLDGWNELDGMARQRARVEVSEMKAEFPSLTLVVATRPQELDIPFASRPVVIEPLSEEQQQAIAATLSPEDGPDLLERAWRTRDVRELVSIPLYLKALLALPGRSAFPASKEELIRHFVATQEKDPRRAEVLRSKLNNLQRDYLQDLAVYMTTTGTTIPDRVARERVGAQERRLEVAGKIHAPLPQSNDILDALVDTQVLVRSGEPAGYAFQHQQFQEWYSSYDVERKIRELGSDSQRAAALKAEIFDHRPWEEAILFAVERLARGDTQDVLACSRAILAAFGVDPMLAAEMIYRGTDAVWSLIGGVRKTRTACLARAGRKEAGCAATA